MSYSVVLFLAPFATCVVAQADPQQQAAPEPETATWAGMVDCNYLAVRPGGKKRDPRTKVASVSRGLIIEIEYLDPPKQKTRRFRGQWIEDDCRKQYGNDAVHRRRAAAIEGVMRGSQMRAKVTDLVDGTWAGDINVNLELIGLFNKDKSEMIGKFQAVGSDRVRAGEFRLKRNKT